jgi:hypothetical protein
VFHTYRPAASRPSWLIPLGQVCLNAQRLHPFLLRGLPRAFSSVEILGRFSSSSLPPYFVTGRLAAIFSTGSHQAIA